MELVEGEDLAQRLAGGPLALADVLSIARQIADALERPRRCRARRRATDQRIGKARQLRPPSTVVNERPSAAVTVALTPSAARTEVSSRVSGNEARCQVWPSVDTSTKPPRPTNQQVVGDGATPAAIAALVPVA
jgi:hypothetical protein